MTHPHTNILVFTEISSSRLKYCLDFVFEEKEISYKTTNNFELFKSSQSIRLNYSDREIEGVHQIKPSGLLSENKIRQDIRIKYDQINKEWLVDQKPDDLSTIFFLLSRYEEYTETRRDEMGRFQAIHSVLYENGMLDAPVCDVLVKQLWEKLGIPYQSVTDKFRLLPSFDIDVAWAYKNKGFLRTVSGSSKSILSGKLPTERFKVLSGKLQDPFDSYELIDQIVKKHGGILFFLLGDWGKYDKNISWKNIGIQKLIQSFSNQSEFGIHPSFESYLKTDKINSEIKRLEVISGKKVVQNRQHFLRLKLPESYRILIELGITKDYSMGYADHYGFRAGTSFPFYFYDLEKDKKTDLKVFPITYMDGTLKDYMKQTRDEAIQTIIKLRKTVEQFGGHFIPVWHNHSITDYGEWKGWQTVFQANFSNKES